MRNFDHVMDRVEREIEELMGEKKWTPQHAQALEELLTCEKCVKEIEKLAHAKKRMMGLPAPTEEEDEEMMAMPWHFNQYERSNYARGGGGNRNRYERNNYDQQNYERGNYEQQNYERNKYDRGGGGGNYERNRYGYEGGNRYHYPPYMPPPYELHYPPYMEEDMWDPRMGPIKPHMYGGNQHMYGWDPMMQGREWSKRKGKRYYDDDDDDDEDEEERRMKKRHKKHDYDMYERSGANGEGTSNTATTGNSQNGSTTGTNTTGAHVAGK